MTQNTVIFFILIVVLIIYLCTKIKKREGLALGSPYMEESYKRLGVTRDKENKIMYMGERRFDYSKGFNDKKATVRADSKIRSTCLVRRNSIPVADSFVWNNKYTLESNVNQIELSLGYPVVVKPSYGEKGYGVTPGILSSNELISAVEPLLEAGNRVLVDKHLNGDEYRIMIYDGDIIGVTKRSKPKIIGDGKNTISKLIEIFNDDKAKSFKCHNVNERIIKEQGFELQDVPNDGIEVIISNVANMSNGGGVEDVALSTIHPDNLTMFKKAAQICELKLTGIDFITPSLLIPYHKMPGECGILEMNTGPGIAVHYYAKGDKKDDFIDGFIRRLFNM